MGDVRKSESAETDDAVPRLAPLAGFRQTTNMALVRKPESVCVLFQSFVPGATAAMVQS